MSSLVDLRVTQVLPKAKVLCLEISGNKRS